MVHHVDEGYIKFECHWTKSKPIRHRDLSTLNAWRNFLWQANLIGAYSDGVGFGNVSIRTASSKQFIISATQTGHIRTLTSRHYTLVTRVFQERNTVFCTGPLKASSESMTHHSLYECSKTIRAIIHIHNLRLWKKLIGRVPTTRKKVPYGTPEMAHEMKRLFQNSSARENRVIVMAGHREGILFFGRHLTDAGSALMRHIDL